MPISFLTTALLIVSVITNLTVEGIKKLLEGHSDAETDSEREGGNEK